MRASISVPGEKRGMGKAPASDFWRGIGMGWGGGVRKERQGVVPRAGFRGPWGEWPHSTGEPSPP